MFMLLLMVILCSSMSQAVHFFTSPISLEMLMKNKELENSVQTYMKETYAKIEKLKIMIQKFESLKHDTSKFRMEHPVAAFHIIHLCANIRSVVLNDTALTNFHQRTSGIPYPTPLHLTSSALDLQFLQTAYFLNYTEIREGVVAGRRAPPLTPDDIFFIGNSLFTNNMFYTAINWLFHCVGKTVTGVPAVQIFSLLARSYEQVKDLESLTSVVDSMKIIIGKVRPSVFTTYLDQINTVRSNAANILDLSPTSDAHKSSYYCRTEQQTTSLNPKVARCRYRCVSSPFNCHKLEIYSDDPYVVFYHDIITERENDALTYLSTDALKDSLLQQVNVNLSVPKNHLLRAWIKVSRSKILHRVNKRISLITEFGGSENESYQAISYGINSEELSHIENTKMKSSSQNKTDHYNINSGMASVVLYLKNAKAGGRASFHRAGFSVDVQKNGVLIWFSEHPTGHKDWMSMYASCPVLHGSQLVLKKWYSRYLWKDPRFYPSDHLSAFLPPLDAPISLPM